jgi:hypothetical protein
LRQSLLGHIRQRAARLQIQADFYSGTPDQFLTLFRLYKFLDDLKGTGGVILAAEAKVEGMKERSTTVSGANQTIYRNESRQWQDLAEQLRAELDKAGLAAPPATQRGLSMAEAEAAQLREKTRLLQLRVDFYQAVATEYQALFDNYLLLNLADRAAVVVERLDERIQRVRWLAQAASQAQEETEYLDEALALDKMKEQMNPHLLSLQPQPASP